MFSLVVPTYSFASRKGCGLFSETGDFVSLLLPREGESSSDGAAVVHNFVDVSCFLTLELPWSLLISKSGSSDS